MDRHEADDDPAERQEAGGGQAEQQEGAVHRFCGSRGRDHGYPQQPVRLSGSYAAEQGAGSSSRGHPHTPAEYSSAREHEQLIGPQCYTRGTLSEGGIPNYPFLNSLPSSSQGPGSLQSPLNGSISNESGVFNEEAIRSLEYCQSQLKLDSNDNSGDTINRLRTARNPQINAHGRIQPRLPFTDNECTGYPTGNLMLPPRFKGPLQPSIFRGPSSLSNVSLQDASSTSSLLDRPKPSQPSHPSGRTGQIISEIQSPRFQNMLSQHYRVHTMREYQEQEQFARDDNAVTDARKQSQDETPGWLACKGWQIEPGYENADLRSYLQGVFPGAGKSFMDEMLRGESVLLKRIQGPMYRTDTWPQLTLAQALTVALMAQPGRAGYENELVWWWERRYPWLVDGQFAIAEGESSRTTFRQHVRFFLTKQACRFGLAIETVSPKTYPYNEGKNVCYNYLRTVWQLPSGLENMVLAEFYNSSGPSVILPRLPLELRTMIHEHYLTYPGILHAYLEHGKLCYYGEAASPDWINTYTRTIIYNGAARKLYLVDPWQLEKRFRTARSLWGLLASTQFFSQNIIAVGNRDRNGYRASQARFFAEGPLMAIGELGRKNLGRVHLNIIIADGGAPLRGRDIARGFELLGESEHLCELGLYLEIQGQARIDAEHQDFGRIPGFEFLRRFRGIRQLTIIITPPALQVGIENWLRPRVTQLKLKGGPQTALQSKPKALSTLANRRTRDELDQMARDYGFDRNIDRLPNGGKVKKDNLARWLSEQLHKHCRDPDYISESQWGNRPKGVVFVRIENQKIHSGSAQSVLVTGQPRTKNPRSTTAPIPALVGGSSSSAQINEATRTGKTAKTSIIENADKSITQVDQAEQPQAEDNTVEASNQDLTVTNESDTTGAPEDSSYTKRKIPPSDEEGTEGKKLKTQ